MSHAQVIHPDTLSAHVHYLASPELEGRAVGSKGKALATTYIQQQFQQAGLKPFQGSYLQHFELKFSLAWVQATNIIGMIEGTDPVLKDEYIVLGADDNASGVAAIIELAKYFKKKENKPRRSLLFIAFDAEESGLLGSKHFVDHLGKDTLSNIKAMFSFDMVGMLEANKGLHLKGIGTLKNGKETAQNHANSLKLLNTSKEIEERTDTEPFGSKGIPAIHVFTGSKSPYHKPEDKAELLDYPGMATVSHYIADLVTDLGNQSELLAISSFKERRQNPKRPVQRFRSGMVLNIGSGRHLYPDEFYDAKSTFALSTGLYFNYHLSRAFRVQVEGLYDYNTSKSAPGTFKRHSLTVPLNLEYGRTVFVFGGAYYRHHFKGKDGDTALDFHQLHRGSEWGYTLGFGVDVSKYRIAFTRREALQSALQQGTKIYPAGRYLTLGYRF